MIRLFYFYISCSIMVVIYMAYVTYFGNHDGEYTISEANSLSDLTNISLQQHEPKLPLEKFQSAMKEVWVQ